MSTSHFVLGNSMVAPWPESMQTAVFGLGCFWGAERKFWQLDGVWDRDPVHFLGSLLPSFRSQALRQALAMKELSGAGL